MNGHATLTRLARRLTLAVASVSLLAAFPACEGDPASDGNPDTIGGTDTGGGGDTAKPNDTGGGGTNRAPELMRIGDRVATVNAPLIIELSAVDPDGDTLTYSVFGALPDGARFDKQAKRFEWTPTEAGKVVFLTFVVSDGPEFDRETVRIEVNAQGTANPPSLAKVGDQQATVGTELVIQLSATDPDGDTLTYGNEGALPQGASLDANSGRFAWTPAADAAGKTERVTFTVSDGGLSDTLTVRIIVGDGSTGGAAPPVFAEIPPQTVAVGDTLTLTLMATDPNDDALTYAISEGAPAAGASLSGATFTYTPPAADSGITHAVIFSVTDGTFEQFTTAQISVTSGQTGSCTQDAAEPNETLDTPTSITPGTTSATLCDTADAFDVDVYAVTASASSELTATLTFDAADGDLDLALYRADQSFISASEGITGTEEVKWTADTEETVLVAVFGIGNEPLAVSYQLATTVGAPVACTDDSAEDNDSPAQAKPLPSGTLTGQLCADDPDYYTLPVTCGEDVDVSLTTIGSADIDMRLWSNAAGDGAPVKSGISESTAGEVILLNSAPVTGTYLLQVVPFPLTDEAGYELDVTTSGACVDDANGGANNSPGGAVSLSPTGPDTSGTLCCGDDWYSLGLEAGDQLLVDATPNGGGATGVTVFGPGGTDQLASEAPAAGGALVSITVEAAGTYVIRVSGQSETDYTLSWDIEAGAVGGCTDLSCDTYDVCDVSSGDCVSDFCLSDADCPPAYTCTETYCANSCNSDDSCRTGYTCKGFADGNRCGLAGPGASGASCNDHTECEGALVCLSGSCGAP